MVNAVEMLKGFVKTELDLFFTAEDTEKGGSLYPNSDRDQNYPAGDDWQGLHNRLYLLMGPRQK